ncbi:MAG: SUMF1/EgtB/PvdO family nonheme iron enzyme [Hyphomicrobiales bacterium]|nr:SUMF1/EgtB/PvdO family nonheme iron enzyme [Hyphomicrobiales bacterium]MBV8442844.1 SUMF1/EgtB/PvdO family nonheme iron enzyme [Hyphomicrobiales bacterium]
MHGAVAIAVGTLALVAPLAVGLAVELNSDGMIALPAGLYMPFLRVRALNASNADATAARRIDAFRLDAEPVTNAQFLDFLIAHPQWRKSRIRALFADDRYLKRWPSDLEPADAGARDEPVTNVSWFAAEAYCKARGLRLPTTEQWEYALADEGRGRETVRARSLEWFAEPNGAHPPSVGGPPNGFGVRDMVGLVWEWTLDFAAYARTGESRDSDGKDSANFCGGAAAGVADATDYPAFMRYSMRASLKADYTADNLGFRCAGGAP